MSRTLSTDELEDRLRVEFIDESHDRLARMNSVLNAVADDSLKEGDGIGQLALEAHSFRGAGTSFGYPGVSLIAHRMEDYMNGLTRLTEREVADLQTFTDRIAQLVDRVEQPQLAETNQIIRSLPVRYVFDVADVEVRDVEVMLVTPGKVLAKKVGTELSACGYRVVTAHDPIESISLAVRMPPDMLMASLVMDGLSGLDLIRGLHAMSVTQHVPMVLMTSMALDDPSLKEIPAGVAVVRTGSQFSDDFAVAVGKFNLSGKNLMPATPKKA
ncbi:MAG TPA: Hpt domain-containing protein [Azospirillaceae bacterium]|nr:Hpt domain-containing protein [Azospirillaceae bacterium]